MLKIAIVVDPLDTFKIYKDSTYAMMQVAQERGHELFILHQEDLLLKGGQVFGHVARVSLLPAELQISTWYQLEETILTPLSEFDAVLMRKDPPFDMEYIYSTYLLEIAEKQGVKVHNPSQAIRDFNEKLAIARYPEFTSPTIVSKKVSDIREFIEEHYDVILKPLDGMGGSSIFKVTPADPNLNVILENMTQFEKRTIMAQRYIPAIKNGDKRVLVIDGEVMPYALARIPKAGETRGNLAAGGKGVAQPLSDRDREIAEKIALELKARQFLIVGLDIIGDYLTEINVTSPTCMQEIFQQTGFNVAAKVIDALERKNQKTKTN